jgi:predicted nucleotidyltransferase
MTGILRIKGGLSMRDGIISTLETIEKENNIQIIYAVESGSRAWGFASADSDYDVRYIYIRPTEDYLRVNDLRDTIEGPLNEILDFSGWDIRKTLELLRRCNPSLMEWYQSPIIYRRTELWGFLAERIPAYFQPRSSMYHYLSMVVNNWNTYLKPSLEKVSVKKYLYVLRPILCCRWLEQFGTVPPVPFDALCKAVLPVELEVVTKDLLEQKKHIEEKALINRMPELDSFILAEIPRLTQVRDDMPHQSQADYEDLNQLFRQMLQDAWK